MCTDLRVKHDAEAGKAAIELFERDHGRRSAARAPSVPRGTMRQGLYIYRAFGSEVLLTMDGKQARYTYEQKVAAASAVIVQSMSRKGNCIDNGATEQVFGHMKDEFFRGREWPDFESSRADLDAYVVHWNTRRRQVKLKGLTPEEFRSQSLAA